MARRAAEGGTPLVLLVLGVLAGGARRGEAQMAVGGERPVRAASGSGVPAAARGADPARSGPINPSVSRPAARRTDASLYFPAAQPFRGRGEEPRPEPRPAARPNPMMIPGGGAAVFFDREPVARPDPKRSTGTRNRHFAHRGR
jgi:hypothetical protein